MLKKIKVVLFMELLILLRTFRSNGLFILLLAREICSEQQLCYIYL